MLTLPAIHDGGSWFNERACHMNTATHTVEVPFPQAFAEPKFCQFPSAPRYCEKRGTRREKRSDRPSGVYAPSCEVLRSLFPALANTFVLLPVTLRHGTQETRFSCQG